MLGASDNVEISRMVAIQAADHGDTCEAARWFRCSPTEVTTLRARNALRSHHLPAFEEIVHRAEHQLVVAGDDTDSPGFHEDCQTHAGCGYRVVEIMCVVCSKNGPGSMVSYA